MTQAIGPSLCATEIHRGRKHRVLRLLDPAAGPLIVKRGRDDGALGPARSALHNEQRILTLLQGLPGCPRLVRYDPATPELAVAESTPLPDAFT